MSTKSGLIASLALIAGLAAVNAGEAGDGATASPWSPGANSRARLVAAGGPEPGAPLTYRAGLEIELRNGAHTYWRHPGDAGVPPSISFEGSRNLKSADLRFPAPERIDEGGLQVFGYHKSLVLPLDVIPEDPRAPVHLAVNFSYAACEKICIPAEAKAALDLAPAQARGPEATRLAAAAAALPARVENGGAVSISARPVDAYSKPAWRIAIERPAGPWRDLFAEGREGWYFETKPVEGGFDLILDESPPGAKDRPEVVLTLAGPRDYEVRIDLPDR